MLASRGICGGDPERIEDTITYARLCDFMSYWAKHPPIDLMMEAQLGVNKPQVVKLF